MLTWNKGGEGTTSAVELLHAHLTMASLWSSLEKEVFNPQNKRLLEAICVWKTGKKKKMSILCVVVDAFRPMQPFLVKVKVDRGEQYKMAYRWPLAELKLVDGKTLDQANLDFDLQFDKIYKWTASSFDEKKTFIRCLWKLNHRFLSSAITFVNVQFCSVEGRQRLQEDRRDVAETENQEELSVYQEMTPKEAADVLKLMEEHEPLVNNSIAFAEQLSRDLHVLDEANLQAIISSEKQVTQLMSSIDEALAEVARVEETLQIYDELLGSVKQQMDHIHQENSLLHHITSNKAKLTDEILFLTTHLDLGKEHCEALSCADLSSPSGVEACIAAAEALSACMSIQIQSGYRKLQAVAEQLIMFETLKQNFENRFIGHIMNIFEKQGNAQIPALTQPMDELSAPSHGLQHEELMPYAPLMAWLRNANPVLFCDLPKVYAQNLSRLYDREIKAFFEQAKILLMGRRKGSLQEGLEKPAGMGSRQHPRWSLPGSREGQEDILNKGNVIKILEQVLRELRPLCIAEQLFIEKFFQLGQNSVELQKLEEEESTASPDDPACAKISSHLEEQTAQLLSEIFSSLDPELRCFLDVCNKAHPFSCLQVLVTLNDCIFEMWGKTSALPSSFLNTVLGNVLLLAKSSFNKCIGTLCKEIEEAKVPSKLKVGILPSVSRFEEFVNFSEAVFRTAQRRVELDKAHLRLADSVFSNINSLSSANLKVNTDMVMMENFHHVHCFLCQKKIQCLEGKKREAKQRYSEHMEKYVIRYLGQPLEKLNHFFEGVKARVAQGVKEEEISFQLAYSKQELRKVIERYPGKEVKRALETLYRKIHKYLSPEENLFPVVWHAMEQELLRQYQEFEDLIQRCYVGSGITMEFTMEDLLSYFNSITLSSA
ncbi:exocyst complex component 1-like isoform X2 [Numida meleagris]|uniref:exocyst complex component 1-like isoform X2 n=1 Tax=Numida meleagris TaxID=8996 RepID=UPI000B3E3258|nr:exocyst complex component 1-like isoform X2 [Numida meleagris]